MPSRPVRATVHGGVARIVQSLPDIPISVDAAAIEAAMQPFLASEGEVLRWKLEVARRGVSTLARLLSGRESERDRESIESEYKDAWGAGYRRYRLDRTDLKPKPWLWRGRQLLLDPAAAARLRTLLFAAVIDDLKPKRILEVGSGNGINLLNLAGAFPGIEFTGLELTDEGVRQARSAQSDAEIAGILRAYSPLDIRRPLLVLAELSNRSQGVFRWQRSHDIEAVLASLRVELADQTELSADFAPDELPNAVRVALLNQDHDVRSLLAPVPAPACAGRSCLQGLAPAGTVRWLIRVLGIALVVALLIDIMCIAFQIRRRLWFVIAAATLTVGIGGAVAYRGSATTAAPFVPHTDAPTREAAQMSESAAVVNVELGKPTSSEPPTLIAHIRGAPVVEPSQIKLLAENDVVVPAARVSPSTDPIALAFVISGQEIWMGNTDYEQDPNARFHGAFHELRRAFDNLPFETLGPAGSRALVVTYDTGARVSVSASDLKSLDGRALGTQTDYKGKIGTDLVQGVTLAVAELGKILEISEAQAQYVYNDIEAKRKTTAPLHWPAITIEKVTGPVTLP